MLLARAALLPSPHAARPACSSAPPRLRPPPPSPPSRTKWTRLVHPSVLIGHVSSTRRRARRLHIAAAGGLAEVCACLADLGAPLGARDKWSAPPAPHKRTWPTVRELRKLLIQPEPELRKLLIQLEPELEPEIPEPEPPEPEPLCTLNPNPRSRDPPYCCPYPCPYCTLTVSAPQHQPDAGHGPPR
jgi:hypothetical protein